MHDGPYGSAWIEPKDGAAVIEGVEELAPDILDELSNVSLVVIRAVADEIVEVRVTVTRLVPEATAAHARRARAHILRLQAIGIRLRNASAHRVRLKG